MCESVSFSVGGNDDGSTSPTAILAGRVKIIVAKELVLPEVGNFDGLAARHFVYKLDVLWIFGGADLFSEFHPTGCDKEFACLTKFGKRAVLLRRGFETFRRIGVARSGAWLG